jgi:hypothetical protein
MHAETPAVNTMETRAGGPQHKMAPCMNPPIVSISDMYTHFMDLLPNLIALHIFQTKKKFFIFFFFIRNLNFELYLSSQILKLNFCNSIFLKTRKIQREDIDF